MLYEALKRVLPYNFANWKRAMASCVTRVS